MPKGAKFHVSWFADDGLHVLDVWDSQADFERFAKERLMPGLQRLGLRGSHGRNSLWLTPYWHRMFEIQPFPVAAAYLGACRNQEATEPARPMPHQ